MKKITFLLILSVLIFAATPSFASEWITVFDDGHSRISVDNDRIIDDGSTFTVFLKWQIFDEKMKKLFSKGLKDTIDYSLCERVYYFDIASAKDKDTTYYNAKSEIVAKERFRNEWQQYPAESLGEIVWQYCRTIVAAKRIVRNGLL